MFLDRVFAPVKNTIVSISLANAFLEPANILKKCSQLFSFCEPFG